MWLIPVLLIGALAIVATKSPREIAGPSRQLAAPPPPPGPPMPPPGIPRSPRDASVPNVSGAPGPISTLGEILKSGQQPPPMVILCAIAEAQALGRNDLVSDIVQVFVAPVVRQHRGLNAKACAPMYQRGSCAAKASPRAQANPPPTPPSPPGPPLAASNAAPATVQRVATQDEILAMLNTDPNAFLQAVATNRPPMVVVPATPTDVPATPTEETPPGEQPTGIPPETVAQMQEAAGQPEAADYTRAMAPGSPLGGVSDDAWRQFVMRLEREVPDFASTRHVGQFRQRRERLAELGINPGEIHGSPAAQRAALDVDLTDAHGHAAEGGLFSYLGRTILVPGLEDRTPITLSGMLGVIQCAGLDGAVQWLEQPNDRKRYPHTTQAFLNTNGVF